MKRILSAAIALAAGASILAAPAFASDNPNPGGATESPQVGAGKWPIVRHAGDRGALDIVVVAPRKDYGLRNVIRHIDRRVDELKFHAAPGTRCSDYPKASLCVKVSIGWYGATKWAGRSWVLDTTNPHRRPIKLNRSYKWYGHGQAIGGHELMHSLGVMHHHEPGIVGAGWHDLASRNELRALRRAY